VTAPALAEQLGPRATRQVRIVSAVCLVVLVGGAVLAVRRLSERGQFDPVLWEPLTRVAVLRFLLGGLVNTLLAGVLGIGLALTWGMLLALGRLSRRRAVRWLVGGYVEVFRSIPLVLLIAFCALGLPIYGIGLGPLGALVVGLGAYNGAVLAEIFRAGVLSLDRGQSEAAAALGLGYWSALFRVVLPQALRRMVPAITSQLVTLMKDTSLGTVAAYEELLRRGRIAGESGYNLLQALFVVAVVYVAMNFTLSRLAARFDRGRSPVNDPEVQAALSAAGGLQRSRRPPQGRRS